MKMTDLLYIYDFINSRDANSRRVSFTKELYGYTYSWKTKSGVKVKRKVGLLEECPGSRIIADSTIIVPVEHRTLFDELFSRYQDIMNLHVFRVEKEV